MIATKTCFWVYDDDDEYWQTDCGNTFVFGHGTPDDNGMSFCPFCGRQVVVAKSPGGMVCTIARGEGGRMSFQSDFDELWLTVNDEIPSVREHKRAEYEVARIWYNTGRFNLTSNSGSCAICGAELRSGDATRLIHAECYDPEEHEMEVIKNYCSWKCLRADGGPEYPSDEETVPSPTDTTGNIATSPTASD